MVFDRRFNAASPRYLGSASNAQQQNDGLRPPLQDYCVLLTRSFLMVLGCGRSAVQQVQFVDSAGKSSVENHS